MIRVGQRLPVRVNLLLTQTLQPVDGVTNGEERGLALNHSPIVKAWTAGVLFQHQVCVVQVDFAWVIRW